MKSMHNTIHHCFDGEQSNEHKNNAKKRQASQDWDDILPGPFDVMIHFKLNVYRV